MRLLLSERKLIIAIGNNIEYGEWGNLREGGSSWRITPSYYMSDGNYTMEDIGDTEIPTYVQPNTYYYINGEFKLADECPNEYKDRIVELEDALAIADETSIELYENQIAMVETNNAQDEAIIELYEMIG